MEETRPTLPPAITFRVYVICDSDNAPAGARLTAPDAIEAIVTTLRQNVSAGRYTERTAADLDRLVVGVDHNATGFDVSFSIANVLLESYRVRTFTTDEPPDL